MIRWVRKCATYIYLNLPSDIAAQMLIVNYCLPYYVTREHYRADNPSSCPRELYNLSTMPKYLNKKR